MSSYQTWWEDEGSAMKPLPNEDLEEFARRITAIAWSNGEFVEREAIRDEWHSCVMSDLESGVKSLNEAAAKKWHSEYPAQSKMFPEWLEARDVC